MIDEGLRHQVIWRHATELCSTFVKPVFQTLFPDIESPQIICYYVQDTDTVKISLNLQLPYKAACDFSDLLTYVTQTQNLNVKFDYNILSNINNNCSVVILCNGNLTKLTNYLSTNPDTTNSCLTKVRKLNNIKKAFEDIMQDIPQLSNCTVSFSIAGLEFKGLEIIGYGDREDFNITSVSTMMTYILEGFQAYNEQQGTECLLIPANKIDQLVVPPQRLIQSVREKFFNSVYITAADHRLTKAPISTSF